MMNYGIPYMGSKSDVIASIALLFPSAENFYDLFGGGFSVTHYMLKNKSHRYKNFYYNEIQSDVVDLVQKAIRGEFNYDRFKPEWVSRETFFERKDQDAYIRLLWSFGNTQKSYLFSREIEPYKRSLHMAVIFDDFNDEAKKIIGLNAWPKEVKTIKQRRFYVRQKVAHTSKGMKRGDLPQLKQLQQLEQLERLEQLLRLEQLQQLQQLQQLHFSSGSYNAVTIKPNSVIYCDIPYEGTASYVSSFDRRAFFEWAEKQTCPVFISEYKIDHPNFKLIYTIERGLKLSPKGKTKDDSKKERVYWNGI